MSEVKFQPNSLINSPKRNCKEIIDLFVQYGFTDNLGHDLVNCQDFIELVELAVLASDSSPKPDKV